MPSILTPRGRTLEEQKLHYPTYSSLQDTLRACGMVTCAMYYADRFQPLVKFRVTFGKPIGKYLMLWFTSNLGRTGDLQQIIKTDTGTEYFIKDHTFVLPPLQLELIITAERLHER